MWSSLSTATHAPLSHRPRGLSYTDAKKPSVNYSSLWPTASGARSPGGSAARTARIARTGADGTRSNADRGIDCASNNRAHRPYNRPDAPASFRGAAATVRPGSLAARSRLSGGTSGPAMRHLLCRQVPAADRLRNDHEHRAQHGAAACKIRSSATHSAKLSHGTNRSRPTGIPGYRYMPTVPHASRTVGNIHCRDCESVCCLPLTSSHRNADGGGCGPGGSRGAVVAACRALGWAPYRQTLRLKPGQCCSTRL